jgi:hypothetical protein
MLRMQEDCPSSYKRIFKEFPLGATAVNMSGRLRHTQSCMRRVTEEAAVSLRHLCVLIVSAVKKFKR